MEKKHKVNPNTLEFWDRYYSGRKVERKNGWLYPEIQPYINELPEGSSILELGCGMGRSLAEIRKATPTHLKLSHKWYGFDYSEAAIQKASKKHKDITFQVFDFTKTFLAKISSSVHYDFIFCIETLEHVDDPVFAMENMKSALAPFGKIFITVPFPNTPLDNNPQNLHYTRFHPQDFINIFNGWNVTTWRIGTQHLAVLISGNEYNDFRR